MYGINGAAQADHGNEGVHCDTNTSLAQQQEAYERAPRDLYSILSMVTKKPVYIIVLQHEDAPGTSGDGRKT